MLAALIPVVVNLLLAALRAHPAAKDTTTPVPGLISLLESLAGLRLPDSTSNDLQDLQTVLSALAANDGGIFPAELVSGATWAQSIFGKFTATEADYVGDQTAILDSGFSWQGHTGDIVALTKVAQAKLIPAGAATVGDALGL